MRVSGSTGVQVCFFFFQAEDGIRDSSVTGVQTCALPISNTTRPAAAPQLLPVDGALPALPTRHRLAHEPAAVPNATSLRALLQAGRQEIGRASCRERV